MRTKLCRPVLVNCNESPVVGDIVVNRDGEIDILSENDGKEYAKTTTKQQLILISLDPNEEIRKGDLHVRYHNGRAGTHIDDSHIEWCHKHKYRKVIALQEQLSPEYINQFLENYNDVDNDVMIEMDVECYGHPDVACPEESYMQETPKLTGRFVTIIEKEKKPVTYTEEEVKELLLKFEHVLQDNMVVEHLDEETYEIITDSDFNTEDWFNENKKR